MNEKKTERFGSSELLDWLYEEDGGFEGFIELCESVLHAKIRFDDDECEFVVEYEAEKIKE